ncbi:MAG: AtpZ/AtpI family protein, partial [Bacteroidales bacterium]
DQNDDGAPRESQASMMRAIGALSSVGIAFVLAVVIGFAAGYGLDRLTGLSPLFTILFFFFGLAAGILNVVRTANAYGRDEAERHPRDNRR